MATKIGINGFGRIGRAFLRAAWSRPELEVVAINDLGDTAQFAYLLKYDSVYGQAPFSVEAADDGLVLDGKKVAHFSEPDPSKIPWKQAGVDIVVESTGLFTEYAKAAAHLTAGAKRVVITAPGKGVESEGATILMGINEDKMQTCPVTSNASCTTNASSPIIQILHEAIGIEKAVLSTTHAYTASQALVDGPARKPKSKDDWRDGRAAAHNIVPSATGAAVAVTKAVTELAGKFDGISLRVPVIAGSIADVTFIAKRDTTVEEVNDALKKAAGEERWRKVFSVTDEPLVSSDIVGSRYAAVADLSMTRVVDGNLVKVLSWYDNEMGYVHSLIEHVVLAAQYVI